MKNINMILLIIGLCGGSMLFVNRQAYGLCENEKRQIQELDKQLLLNKAILAKTTQQLEMAQREIIDLNDRIDADNRGWRDSVLTLYFVLAGGLISTIVMFLLGIGLGAKARKDAHKHSTMEG
ncbi:hypothetical protein U27_06971 [Candidatus Vecturithrix granuli]|uniref:Uncharacterized protein n=1 Tax=Vecturithrix granuli TaxID=1499967 RepID=A0A081C5X9_VECG1|nr:hypothetical protein U27_06971 [Candidatus Vecturithrix granuli]